MSHTELGAWYTQTIRDNCAECEVDGVVIGGGFYDSLLGRHGEAGGDPQDAVRNSATRDTSYGVPPIEADSVFNGDFRFDGRVENGTFKMFEEKHRIPDWFSNRRPEVTAEGRLRLSTARRNEPGPDTVTVTHNPFFTPPRTVAVQFDVHNRVSASDVSEPSSLAVYFVPVGLDDFGKLTVDSDRRRWSVLGSWKLSAAADNSANLAPDVVLSLTLPIHPASVGRFGAICFEAQTPHASADVTDLVEIDNVRLVPSLSGNSPVAATSALRERR